MTSYVSRDRPPRFRKSAAQGNRVASFNLGLLHRRGDGVERSEREARAWFERAAVRLRE